MEWFTRAKDRLENEMRHGKFGKRGDLMVQAVLKALLDFCRQDAEFAQAVVQGGSLEDCMKAVTTDVGNCISDLEAYRRAVKFYFPGADVRFHMTVDLCASVRDLEDEPGQKPAGVGKVLDLAAFLM